MYFFGYIKKLIVLVAILLLCGFFWPKADWESVNKLIDKLYPSVASISTDTLKIQLNSQVQFTIIDVRAETEYMVSHLPGAINVTDVKKLQLPKSSTVIVYCSVGIRSARFAKEMDKQGYTSVFNLRGSIFEWANKGYPVYHEGRVVHAVHPYNKKWGKLLNSSLHPDKENQL